MIWISVSDRHGEGPQLHARGQETEVEHMDAEPNRTDSPHDSTRGLRHNHRLAHDANLIERTPPEAYMSAPRFGSIHLWTCADILRAVESRTVPSASRKCDRKRSDMDGSRAHVPPRPLGEELRILVDSPRILDGAGACRGPHDAMIAPHVVGDASRCTRWLALISSRQVRWCASRQALSGRGDYTRPVAATPPKREGPKQHPRCS
jgi:hypothetical protein